MDSNSLNEKPNHFKSAPHYEEKTYPHYDHAIDALVPGARWEYMEKEREFSSWESDTDAPTNDEIDTKLAELIVVWETREYRRNRAPAYPNIGDQLDMMYKDMKNSTTTHADALEAVKTKWPKDNSGPVE